MGHFFSTKRAVFLVSLVVAALGFLILCFGRNAASYPVHVSKEQELDWLKMTGILLASMGVTSALTFPALSGLRRFFGLEGPPDEGLRATAVQQGYSPTIIVALERPPDPRAEDIANRRAYWPATIVGMSESAVYPLAFCIDKAEFVGVWLAVKVAAQWNYWDDDKDEPIEGRTRFYVFLLGNMISICAAFITSRLLLGFAGPRP